MYLASPMRLKIALHFPYQDPQSRLPCSAQLEGSGGNGLSWRRFFVNFVVLSICCGLLPGGIAASTPNMDTSEQAAWALAQSDPTALMKQSSQNELASTQGNHPLLRYQVTKVTAKIATTKEIVQTVDGGVARLVLIDGHPLTTDQQNNEIERLHALAADPNIQAHRRRHENRDAEHVSKIMRLLPDAFIYKYADTVQTSEGQAIRMTFVPNPKFSPPDLETRMLTAIRGEVWIDPTDERVIHLQGQIFHPVDFGWGLLGVLDSGGSVLIEQTKTRVAGWQLAHLKLDLNGKAFLVKRLHLSTDETISDYHRVPAGWHYRDAVAWLLQWQPASSLNTH